MKYFQKDMDLQIKRNHQVLSTVNEWWTEAPKPQRCKMSEHRRCKDVSESLQKGKKKVTYKDKNQMPSSSKFWEVRIFKIEFYIYQNISQAWGEY